MPEPDEDEYSNTRARFRVGQRVTVNGVAGEISRPGHMIDAESVRANPAFDPNYESEQGGYNGPLWHPLNESAQEQENRWKKIPKKTGRFHDEH